MNTLEQHTAYVGGNKHGNDKDRSANCGVATAGVSTTSDGVAGAT